MKFFNNLRLTGIVALVLLGQTAWAQRGEIQYFRSYDQRGINVFETSKNDTLTYDGLKLRIGANFSQGYQSLKHSNADNTPGQQLFKMKGGFPLAQANLNIDVQIADGVRLNLVSYMSSHHHNEFWVKGGYLQIDKVGFMHSDLLNRLWTDLTLKVGHMEINYGDAHFRRSDGGNTMWNPFMENNIMDAFTTEIGGELAWQKNGVILMGGATNGEIQGNVAEISIAGSSDNGSKRGPSLYGKIGYDKLIGQSNRVRITGSFLRKNSSISGTLYGGDRTGSNYQYVMEPIAATLTANAFSGRVNPNFKDNVTTFMINPFVKLGGFELFGTYEVSKGNTAVENGEIQYNDGVADPETFNKQKDRRFTQLAADALFRFGAREQFYVGAKYNTVKGEQVFGQGTTPTAVAGINQGARADISVDRTSVAAGWFVTRNILLKSEYVTQKYKGFPAGNIFENGRFSGFVLQGVIAF
jgi:hypothetical protein